MKHVITFGGGVNSVAMTVLLVNQGAPIDYIIFADTKGEKPETYQYLDYFEKWLEGRGYPKITRVTYNKEGLYNECIRRKALPGLAYGFKSCSEKFKIRPSNRFLKENITEWPITKYVGYDTDEEHRIKNYTDKNYIVKYPLVAAGMDRQDCKMYLAKNDVVIPMKSACFFCPAMRRSEVEDLKQRNPDLYQKAVAMEENADLSTIAGLGRRWSWKEAGKQGLLFETAIEISCECAL